MKGTTHMQFQIGTHSVKTTALPKNRHEVIVTDGSNKMICRAEYDMAMKRFENIRINVTRIRFVADCTTLLEETELRLRGEV